MKIGDLIRYNCAGMTDKTLGLVIDSCYRNNKMMICINWCMVGDIMPRIAMNPPGKPNNSSRYEWNRKAKTGDILWYDDRKWFQVVP